jgi:hypothetical protein
MLVLPLFALPLYAQSPAAPAKAAPDKNSPVKQNSDKHPAQPIPVRYIQGTVHGFLVLKSEDGKILASGDSIQTVRGDQVTVRGAFHLITDHHIQKGPFFPHPNDVLIDTRSGQVTVHSTGKDGKEEVKTDHLTLPADLANGMVPLVAEHIKSGVAETTVPMLVLTPKPRLIKLLISPQGEESFAVAGSPRKAIHYEIKIQIGGIEGMVAPFVGKAPPNIDLWIVGGQAPTFLREQGPTYTEGPIVTIELASPAWPDAPKPAS